MPDQLNELDRFFDGICFMITMYSQVNPCTAPDGGACQCAEASFEKIEILHLNPALFPAILYPNYSQADVEHARAWLLQAAENHANGFPSRRFHETPIASPNLSGRSGPV
jgi:hypothetical protein